MNTVQDGLVDAIRTEYENISKLVRKNDYTQATERALKLQEQLRVLLADPNFNLPNADQLLSKQTWLDAQPSTGWYANPKNKYRVFNLEQQLRANTSWVLKEIFDTARMSYMGEMIQTQHDNTALAERATNIYIRVFDEKVKQVIEQNKQQANTPQQADAINLSIEQYQQIQEELKAIFPSIKTPFIGENALDWTDNGYHPVKSVETLQEDLSSEPLTRDSNGNINYHQLSASMRKMVFKGLATTSFQTQSVDAYVTAITSSGGGHPNNHISMNNHDSNSGGIHFVTDMAKAQNKAFFYGLATYHANEATLDAFLRTILGALNTYQGKKPPIALVGSSTGNIDSLLNLVKTTKQQELAKLKGLLALQKIQQYATEGGEYLVAGEDRTFVIKQIEALEERFEDYEKQAKQIHTAYKALAKKQNNGEQTNKAVTKPNLKESLTLSERNGSVINIWHGSNENANLSNLALRPFTAKNGRKYQSVEHFYQSHKTGKFDETIYGNVGWFKAGTKIKKGTAKTENDFNIKLMKAGIKMSFEQNPRALRELLATGNATLTHTQETGMWREMFPKLLMEVRDELGQVEQQESTDNLVKETKAYFDKYLKGKSFDTVIGKVHVLGSSWQKKLKHGIKTDHLRAKAIPFIPDILTKGVYEGKQDLGKIRNDTYVAFHSFTKELDIDDEKVFARLLVGERANNEYKFVAYSIYPKKENSDIGDSGDLARAVSEFEDSVANQDEDVKPTLTGKSPYLAKDQAKSDIANKFIGFGAKGSSTDVYRQDWGNKANTGSYTSTDKVFVSINGKRPNRIGVEAYKAELDLAIQAGAVLITDKAYDRNRPFNVGEREVAEYLNQKGYVETSDGIWGRASNESKDVKYQANSFGERPNLKDVADIDVVEINAKELGFKQTKQLADEILRQLQQTDAIYNHDTGWNLQVGKKDRKKMGDNNNLSHATSQAVQGIKELVRNAVVAETHQDVKHGNERVTAIHRMYVPADINGQLHRVKLTIKDYSLNDGTKRKNLHAIEAIEIENALLGTLPPDATNGVIQGVAQPTTGHKLSIVNLLKGVKHDGDDGVFFDTAPTRRLGFKDLETDKLQAQNVIASDTDIRVNNTQVLKRLLISKFDKEDTTHLYARQHLRNVLALVQPINPTVEIKVTADGDYQGVYDISDNTITISETYANTASYKNLVGVLTHELGHATTMQRLRDIRAGKVTSPKVLQALNHLINKRNTILTELNKAGVALSDKQAYILEAGKYSDENQYGIEELISHVLGNDVEALRLLTEYGGNKTDLSKNTKGIKAFINAVKNLFTPNLDNKKAQGKKQFEAQYSDFMGALIELTQPLDDISDNTDLTPNGLDLLDELTTQDVTTQVIANHKLAAHAYFNEADEVYAHYQDVAHKSTIEVLKQLPKGNISETHNAKLDGLIDTLLSSFYNKHHNASALLANQDKLDKAIISDDNQVLSHGFNLSAKELASYQAVKAVLDSFGNAQRHEAYQELRHIYEEMLDNKAGYQQFINSDNPTKDDIELAKKQYDFLFPKKETDHTPAHRLVALSLTSEQMYNLLNQKRQILKNKSDNQSWFDKAMGLFKTLLDVLLQKVKGDKSKPINAQIDFLVNKLTKLDEHYRLQSLRRSDKLWEYRKFITVPANKAVKGALDVGKSVTVAVFPKTQTYFDAVVKTPSQIARDISNAINASDSSDKPLGTLRELMNEYGTTTIMQKLMTRMLATTQSIGQERELTRASTKSQLLAFFKDKPTANQAQAITKGLYETDASSLLNYHDMDTTLGLIVNHSLRDGRITAIRNQITHNFQLNLDEINGIIKATMVAARKMYDGATLADYFSNPELIAFTYNKPNNKELIGLIDELTTLTALRYSHDGVYKKADMSELIALIQNDEDAIRQVLKHHHTHMTAFKTQEFASNPFSFTKGYTPELYDELRAVKAVTGEELQEYLNKGWALETPDGIKQDDFDDTHTRYLVTTADAGKPHYQSGVLELSDTHAKGTVVYEDSIQVAQIVKKQIKERALHNKEVSWQSFSPFDEDTNPKGRFIASYNPDGSVANLHYEMESKTRDRLLNRNLNFSDIMGSMVGNTQAKQPMREHQRDIVRALHKDYTDAMKSPDANMLDFLVLTPDSSDPQIAEHYRLLPYSFKDEANKLFGYNRPIYIRKDIYNMVLGYRRVSLANVWDKPENELNEFEKRFKNLVTSKWGDKARGRVLWTGKHWGALVKQVQKSWVVRNPSTLKGNVISNALLLSLKGVNPKEVITGHVRVWKHGKEYRDLVTKVARIKVQLEAGTANQDHLLRQLTNLTASINSHYLHKFMQAGLMSTIVEDISDDKGQYTSALTRKLDKFYNNLPKPLKATLDFVFITEDSKLYKALYDATQFSDFAAKVLLMEQLMKEGHSFNYAYSEAQDAFIAFDVPTSKYMDYANRIGLFMFTKWAIRFQRVLEKQFKKTPASVIMQHLLIEKFTDEAGIANPWVGFDIISGNTGLEDGAFGLLDAYLHTPVIDHIVD
ncbi:hypothetical protein LU293_09615 [Moraxella nasovis]|uniref:LPD3 domain-containing protein n=1 Tax=Moraxella nasovis TaxID=2904121 RepID=UPI001F6204CE|nr:hypothetical protein [Moraxella nasovis]UNU73304.1 hypothetical protein LU293_09615 [Moraxella nasovis]